MLPTSVIIMREASVARPIEICGYGVSRIFWSKAPVVGRPASSTCCITGANLFQALGWNGFRNVLPIAPRRHAFDHLEVKLAEFGTVVIGNQCSNFLECLMEN